ncbi:right-handed parallel beta-helix repeat-containing protein [Chitinophaga oryzae]|uniref:Right-handed parallel beta-helix repeat-containing protein n=1 Tax=Chitinophaga oryzae TaxID=2725414 RepID=A0AAE6ZHL5_9BACT|nr:chondroitinase-B domain-containing protein [Chitinophaga oryzae]QJB33130.1 right-handed parallel beta-helix repeat-containing protein [Chitinophaga oryzae]QJB39605.1 right-handed parallel beta-helix repeat-containing protein [Chitinophaga oryzae]
MRKKLLPLLLLCWLAAAQASTAQTTVTSLSALQSAINNAGPGDVIILANGTYTASADISITKQGTAAQPITIRAQSVAGAIITGTGGFNISSPARYIVVQGFKFTHSASKAKTGSGTSFCRFTRNIFETPGDGENLTIAGSHHEIDYNTFQHKNALGRFLAIRGSGSQIADSLWIHHNYFLDQQPQSGNGIETLQFGLSGYSMSSSNSIVEYNLFEQCAGENEMISVKASAVTLRYNTIRDCPAQFTLRHGNKCKVYGNYFINTPGIRIFGDDHFIYSNHFESCNPAINIGNGDGEVADGSPLTCHDRPDRVLIAFNTLVNNTSNITQSGRTDGLGATYTNVAYNIIQGGSTAAQIAGPYTNPTWKGNIIYSTSAGAIPGGGYVTANPQVARDTTGTFHLQSGSPAIGAATSGYTDVKFDMDGQSRSLPLDAGADQVSTAPVTARILTPAMVGHNANSTPPVNQLVDLTDNGGVITGQYPNTTKPSEDIPSLIDNNTATKYFRSGRTALWVQYKSTTPAAVTKYTLTSGNDVPGRDPKNWTLQGSNDTITWTSIDSRSNQTFDSRGLTKSYTCTNTTAYRYYRLNITANNGDTGTQLAEWELFALQAGNMMATVDMEVPVNVYPNPTTGLFKVKLTDKKNKSYRLIVLDAKGHQVAATVLGADQTTLEANFNLTAMPGGMYFVQVSDGLHQTTRSVFKY